MVARMHGHLRTSTRPPPAPSFANKKEQMADRKGWTKTSNQQYREELKRLREGHDRDKAKNSGRKCDKCTMDHHDNCYRVGCYCPCVKDKEWYDGKPYRTVVRDSRNPSDLE